VTLGHINKNIYLEAATHSFIKNVATYNLKSVRHFAAHSSIRSIATYKSIRTAAAHCLL